MRWRISQDGDVPMGIAGLYRRWRNPKGGELYTFTMITVNADAHPLYRRMQKPGDEKRMVVILDPQDYLPWLTCSLRDAPAILQAVAGTLLAEPAPLARAPQDGRGAAGQGRDPAAEAAKARAASAASAARPRRAACSSGLTPTRSSPAACATRRRSRG